jgi:hypothetical protein
MGATLILVIAVTLCGRGVSSAIVSVETRTYDTAMEDIADKLLNVTMLASVTKAGLVDYADFCSCSS